MAALVVESCAGTKLLLRLSGTAYQPCIPSFHHILPTRVQSVSLLFLSLPRGYNVILLLDFLPKSGFGGASPSVQLYSPRSTASQTPSTISLSSRDRMMNVHAETAHCTPENSSRPELSSALPWPWSSSSPPKLELER